MEHTQALIVKAFISDSSPSRKVSLVQNHEASCLDLHGSRVFVHRTLEKEGCVWPSLFYLVGRFFRVVFKARFPPIAAFVPVFARTFRNRLILAVLTDTGKS